MQPESQADYDRNTRGMGQIGGGCVPTPNIQGVNINKVENGFIVQVGCKTFVFPAWELVSEGLALYFKSPEEAMKKYCR